MSEGTINKLFADRGFGCIETGDTNNLLFHFSVLKGLRSEDLRIGQRVTYEVNEEASGDRAEAVWPV